MMHEHSNNDEAVRALAARAGLQEHWIDAHGHPRQVELQTLRALLTAMGRPCQTREDIRASIAG
ncbi:MAG TPA: hypothetical protein VL024_01160, partial [Castellaniella sp.]|nr:hypothetical protein [Castellaniella sp.]